MYVVEIKWRKRIMADVVDEVKEKIGKIRRPSRISVRKAIIFDDGLAPVVRRTGYFDFIIDVGTMN